MLWARDKSGKKACTEVRNIEFVSKQPSKFFVFTFLSLQFKFSVHSCILSCLIAFPPIHLLISLLPVIFFKLAITRALITRTFLDFPWRFELSGVDCILWWPTAVTVLCFCREVFGFAVRLSLLPWGILFLPSGFWFCREVFVFAVRFSVLQWGILFLPWGFWFCRDSCGPP